MLNPWIQCYNIYGTQITDCDIAEVEQWQTLHLKAALGNVTTILTGFQTMDSIRAALKLELYIKLVNNETSLTGA